MRTTSEAAPNPKPRQGEKKHVPVKETQGERSQVAIRLRVHPHLLIVRVQTRAVLGPRPRARVVEDYLTKYLQAKQRHFGGGDNTRIREYLAKEAEFKGKKLKDLDVGPVIDFV
jgi:hypothetical protein